MHWQFVQVEVLSLTGMMSSTIGAFDLWLASLCGFDVVREHWDLGALSRLIWTKSLTSFPFFFSVPASYCIVISCFATFPSVSGLCFVILVLNKLSQIKCKKKKA